ncbi:hypothetical protein [Flavobacterium sp. UMI-01]|uniref:hypothetical protein n=1 Tax=Flavobacterium sp. UMI-01 TaxID=1441053 RepID=UPI001C7DF345|nr:hypothetical protein [Flavobacterium sp. UMI-01]GIZ07820.1 hypothetical protein FUMI01_05470 [Flavobacterium sp. UMI-01]
MKIKITLLAIALVLTSCASGYKNIQPEKLNYNSVNATNEVVFSYKYGLLDKKYFRKEKKNNIKLVAIKITNNSNRDLVFGEDIKLTYDSGNEIYLHDDTYLFRTLKQSPASHLLYLLLTPMKFYTYTTNQYGQEVENSSFPIGLFLGPGIAGGNLMIAAKANSKFKTDLMKYAILGKTIKSKETAYGLIGFNATTFEGLRLKIN